MIAFAPCDRFWLRRRHDVYLVGVLEAADQAQQIADQFNKLLDGKLYDADIVIAEYCLPERLVADETNEGEQYYSSLEYQRQPR